MRHLLPGDTLFSGCFSHSEELQRAAADAGGVRQLAGLLLATALAPNEAATRDDACSAAAGPGAAGCAGQGRGAGAAGTTGAGACNSSEVREGVLRALGALCLARDEGRKQLMEAKVSLVL